jgi:hypothetical protein
MQNWRPFNVSNRSITGQIVFSDNGFTAGRKPLGGADKAFGQDGLW